MLGKRGGKRRQLSDHKNDGDGERVTAKKAYRRRERTRKRSKGKEETIRTNQCHCHYHCPTREEVHEEGNYHIMISSNEDEEQSSIQLTQKEKKSTHDD